eukprot:383370-Rhodomonas_salina.1
MRSPVLRSPMLLPGRVKRLRQKAFQPLRGTAPAFWSYVPAMLCPTRICYAFLGTECGYAVIGTGAHRNADQATRHVAY